RERYREHERVPSVAAADVGAPLALRGQMKVQERLAPRVEHARRLLDDTLPRADFREDTGQVVEQVERKARHRAARCERLTAPGPWSRPLRPRDDRTARRGCP